MKNFKTKRNNGFVALFTVLIAAVILAMAVGISNIALKQIVLSSSATEANKSFYAADSGIECVLYHDINGTPPNSFDPGSLSFNINCGGDQITVNESNGFFSEFMISVGENNDSCAYVEVDKTDLISTRVISRGVNVPCGTTSSRMVERAIEVTY